MPMKRSRGLDPDVVVQIRETLIVKALRLSILRPRIVVNSTDARANRHRTLEKFLRNRRDGVRGMLAEGGRLKAEG